MTHDNLPTAAPLTREQIASCRKFACFEKNWVNKLCDMALRSLARPVPSYMAEDVKEIREALESEFDMKYEGNRKLLAALDRIVAHLSQNNSTPPLSAGTTAGASDNGKS